MKKTSLGISMFLLLGMLPSLAGAQGKDLAPGQLVKSGSSSSVYYIDADLSRHAFPNANVYHSWYSDFDGVLVVDDETLAEYPLAGLVPYKAAVRLVKLQTDPRTYAVDEGGTLRWVRSEQAAKAIFGENWADLVDDLADSFFANYTIGDEISDENDFDENKDRRIESIMQTLIAKRLKHLRLRGANAEEFENRGYGRNREAVCHKSGTEDQHTIFIPKPAVSAHLNHGDAMGECDRAGEEQDETAPVISEAVVTDVTTTSAVVEFLTDEDTDATVYYSATTPVDTATAESGISAAAATSHSIELTGLTADTTYHIVIVAKDAAGNTATSAEMSFITDAEDTLAPTILTSAIDSVSETSAAVHLTTDEDTTATVYFSTTTPVDIETVGSVASATLAASHDIALSGLTAETTYHVLIVVEDEAGNETTSAELSFTTLAADTTAPVVSNIVLADITDAGASVSFDTDEGTTAEVFFSITTPVDAETADSETSATLATSHDVELTGLTAETTYYVLIVATDESGNETTVAEQTFATLAAA